MNPTHTNEGEFTRLDSGALLVEAWGEGVQRQPLFTLRQKKFTARINKPPPFKGLKIRMPIIIPIKGRVSMK